MSLILEALRKSEAQRRLGQAPDLHSPATPTTPRSRLPRWLVPALALMLVGAVAWWLGRMAVPDPSNGLATEAVVVPLPLEPGPAPATATDVPTSAMPPSQADAGQASSAAPAAPASSPPATPTPPSTAAPAPAPAAAPVVSSPPPEAIAPPAVDPQPQPRTVLGLPATSPSPSAQAAMATATDEPEHDLLRLADLPTATRARLPELRISMHVFAEEPSRRFAIIDGRRVGEGGLLEGQGVVEAIRRDGIVVDFDGQRVLLPRP